MAVNAVDESQRKAAKIAGFTFLFAMAIVLLGYYGITTRLIIPDNASETANNRSHREGRVCTQQ